MLRLLLIALLPLACATPSAAQTIYPLDRAEILAGARFDLKVEFPQGPETADAVSLTIDGRPAIERVGASATFVAREEGQPHAALWLRDATLRQPGIYTVEARHGDARATVRWHVFDTPPPKARNVVLFIGDGLSNAHRVAARMLSKGIREGRYGGELAIDDMPHMALVSTAGTDSIITDSANSMSAYTTGHKTCVSALAVYCARNRTARGHPRVEPIASLATRLGRKAIGIVTNTALTDATPAAVFAQTRTRADREAIAADLLALAPAVALGGGSAHFLPAPNGRRGDGRNLVAEFEQAGYRIAATARELAAAADAGTRKLLGLFHPATMDGALDRRVLRKGTVQRHPDQPDLVDQTKAALAVLERYDDGFFLMVESGLIDRFSHALDWERAAYDTIMLDQAVAAARAWAAPRGDTLIVVVGDHTHPVSIVGTYDDSRPDAPLRERLGIYNRAGFPTYPTADITGYPPSVDVSRRLAFTFSAFPDHCDAGRPFLQGPNRPGQETACTLPGAIRRPGNLPATASMGVHSAEDVVLTAMGPGAEAFRGRIDNTRVFRAIVSAFGLSAGR